MQGGGRPPVCQMVSLRATHQAHNEDSQDDRLLALPPQEPIPPEASHHPVSYLIQHQKPAPPSLNSLLTLSVSYSPCLSRTHPTTITGHSPHTAPAKGHGLHFSLHILTQVLPLRPSPQKPTPYTSTNSYSFLIIF